MRRKKAELRTRVKQNLSLEFTEAGLTSYAGVELLGRYLRGLRFNVLLRQHLREVWTYLYALIALVLLFEGWSAALRRRFVA